MCYTRKSSVSEDRKAADNRTDEMRTRRTGLIDSLLGSGSGGEKTVPEKTPAEETVPAE
jgi:hypothetical protein